MAPQTGRSQTLPPNLLRKKRQPGGVRGYEVTAWYGICAPVGVPPAIVAKLNAGLVKVLNSPALQQRLEEQGIDVTPSTPAQFAAHVKAETVKWAKVVKAMGLEEK